MNSEGHYLVVISVAKRSDRHYNLPHADITTGSDLIFNPQHMREGYGSRSVYHHDMVWPRA